MLISISDSCSGWVLDHLRPSLGKMLLFAAFFDRLGRNPRSLLLGGQLTSYFYPAMAARALGLVNSVQPPAPLLQCRLSRLSSRSLFSTPPHIPQKNVKMKVMFFGTDDFAVKSLVRLHKEVSSEEGCLRGLAVTVLQMKSLTPAVTKYASQHGLDLYHWPPDPGLIGKEGFDLGVVASFGRLLPASLISAFPLGMINVHGSLLPRWRGAAPVVHAIMRGDPVTGVTIMRVKPKKFDVGEVLARREVQLDPDILRGELTAQLAESGSELLMEVLKDFPKYSTQALPQSSFGVTHAPLVTRSMAQIDFETMDAKQVYDLWRALGDLAKLHTIYSGTKTEVRLATCYPPSTTATTNQLKLDARPGTIQFLKLGKKKKYVCVKCREGWAAFSGIYYGKRKEMNPTDFYNGYLSKIGEHTFIHCSKVKPPDGS